MLEKLRGVRGYRKLQVSTKARPARAASVHPWSRLSALGAHAALPPPPPQPLGVAWHLRGGRAARSATQVRSLKLETWPRRASRRHLSRQCPGGCRGDISRLEALAGPRKGLGVSRSLAWLLLCAHCRTNSSHCAFCNIVPPSARRVVPETRIDLPTTA